MYHAPIRAAVDRPYVGAIVLFRKAGRIFWPGSEEAKAVVTGVVGGHCCHLRVEPEEAEPFNEPAVCFVDGDQNPALRDGTPMSWRWPPHS